MTTSVDKIETNFISSCPSEIILKIISYLPKRYTESLKCTSKLFNDCLQKNGMILTDLQKENVNISKQTLQRYIELNNLEDPILKKLGGENKITLEVAVELEKLRIDAEKFEKINHNLSNLTGRTTSTNVKIVWRK